MFNFSRRFKTRKFITKTTPSTFVQIKYDHLSSHIYYTETIVPDPITSVVLASRLSFIWVRHLPKNNICHIDQRLINHLIWAKANCILLFLFLQFEFNWSSGFFVTSFFEFLFQTCCSHGAWNLLFFYLLEWDRNFLT